MIPGQNLLKMCLTVIAKQGITYYMDKGRTQNSVGQDVTIFSRGIRIHGSWQPVPRLLYMKYGLDLQKDYFTFYTSHDLLDLTRDVSGDEIAFNGQRYKVESDNDWYALDGWKGVIACHIGTDIADRFVWGFGGDNTNQNFCHGNFLGREV